ncbi:sensor histidine kinase [Muribaculum intestinale]|uniref:sensor histidine kinase n=2 Tax=Muribaculum intestinale TaxID=1796646 RepID=UPI00272B4246|nr:ATP-binding protein [Muribaculum intestinale]
MFRYGKLIFLIAVAAVVAIFLYISNGLVRDLAAQERERMEIWADATKEIISVSSIDHDTAPSVDIDFLLRIIERNTTIPVLLTDDNGSIMQQRNFSDMPDALNPDNPLELSQANEVYLQKKLENLRQSPNVIDIEIAPGEALHLYYEDSTLLKRLNYFPYIQLLVMLAFIVVVYFAVLSSKKAEQNKVWVGLSKETAHQLGTPISSLMAWMELLPDYGVDSDTVAEMNKDVNRLSMIASRFSKIGSKPQMATDDLNNIVEGATGYMYTRISRRIRLSSSLADCALPVMACRPLLEWVLENLIKNAVDAMEADGSIAVSTGNGGLAAWIEVRDSGKGISRKNFKKVFSPGFTTKKRGWGLGLTLAKRIVEQYHQGRIYVKNSVPGQGTTFRIEIPLNRN